MWSTTQAQKSQEFQVGPLNPSISLLNLLLLLLLVILLKTFVWTMNLREIKIIVSEGMWEIEAWNSEKWWKWFVRDSSLEKWFYIDSLVLFCLKNAGLDVILCRVHSIGFLVGSCLGNAIMELTWIWSCCILAHGILQAECVC